MDMEEQYEMPEYHDDAMYDIDNRDIEEEMNQRDIEDEEAEYEKEQEEKEEEEISNAAVKSRKLLNKKNLELDLKIKSEIDRTHYIFSKNDIHYEGYVVSKMPSGKYIFNVKQNDNDVYNLKAFNVDDLT